MWVLGCIAIVFAIVAFARVNEVRRENARLRERLSALDARLSNLEGESDSQSTTPATPDKNIPIAETMARAKALRDEGSRPVVESAAFSQKSPAAKPPPIPQSPPSPELAPKPERDQIAVSEILRKAHLLPPTGENAEAGLAAWWTIRLGILLGVIAAIFFGVHVNQQTPPLIKLMQLVATGIGVFAAGWWAEKKFENFGQVLSTGGLGLLYVAAFACYGLPAMKVTDSASTGILAQLVGVALMVGWGTWRGKPSVAAVGVVLGVVSSWFAARWEVFPDGFLGFTSVSVVGLFLVSICASLLLIWKGWLAPIVCAIPGALGGIILILLAGDPEHVSGFMVCVYLFLVFALAISWRAQRAWTKDLDYLMIAASSLAVVVGFNVAQLAHQPLENYFLAFALIFGAVSITWWRAFKASSLVPATLGLKSISLFGMWVIAEFGGEVRWFALLGQSAAVMSLNRRLRWKGFDLVIPLLWGAAIVACFYSLDLRELELSAFTRDQILTWVFCLLGVVIITWRYDPTKLAIEPEVGRNLRSIAIFSFGALALISAFRFEAGADEILLVSLFVFACSVLIFPLVSTSRETTEQGDLRWWSVPAENLPMVGIISGLLLGTVGVFLGGCDLTELRMPVGLWSVIAWLATAGWLLYCGTKRWGGRGKWPLVAANVMVLGIGCWVCFGLTSARLPLTGQWVSLGLIAVALAGFSRWLRLEGASLVVGWSMLLAFISYADGRNGQMVIDRLGAASIWIWLGLTAMLGAWCIVGVWKRTGDLSGNETDNSEHDSLQATLQQWGAWLSGLVFVLVILAAGDWQWRGREMPLCVFIVVALWLVAAASRLVRFVGAPLCVLALLMVGTYVFLNAHDHKASVPILVLGLVYAVSWGAVAEVLFRCSGVDRYALPKWACVVVGALLGLWVLGPAEFVSSERMTVRWGLLGLAAFVAGLAIRSKAHRVVGLGLIGVTVARMFVVDIQDTVGRIIAFAATAAVLVGIGFLYAKFRNRIDS